MRCLECGCESDELLCKTCAQTADRERLIREMLAFVPDEGKHPLWEAYADGEDTSDLQPFAFELAGEIPSPLRERLQLLVTMWNRRSFRMEDMHWVLPAAEKLPKLIKNEEDVCIALGLLNYWINHYQFQQAEAIADRLLKAGVSLPAWGCGILGEYYTKTRRYETAAKLLDWGIDKDADDDWLRSLKLDNDRRRGAATPPKRPYKPQDQENRDAYYTFLESIGIEAEENTAASQEMTLHQDEIQPLAPAMACDDAESFVAYDFETTGLSAEKDAIIEIGAVKVINGVVQEAETYTFQEFIRPWQNEVSPRITELTGIRPEDVADAREMPDVLADFIAWTEGMTMIGYNNISFDNRFLQKACEHFGQQADNEQKDALLYARQFRSQLCMGRMSLTELSQRLEIVNPRAHRALADALTTARVYLKLRDMVRQGSLKEK